MDPRKETREEFEARSAMARGWSPARIMALESLLLAPPAGAGLAMMGDPSMGAGAMPGPVTDPEEPPSGMGEMLKRHA